MIKYILLIMKENNYKIYRLSVRILYGIMSIEDRF
jgi:hypothetical protein